MTNPDSFLVFDPHLTALLVVDPYNDFLSEGGKLWPMAKEVAEGVNLLPNMRAVLSAARDVGIKVFYLPHHRYRPGDYDGWARMTPLQVMSARSRVFEDGSWGGAFHPDFQPREGEVVALEHWCSSGFANTDLDFQLKTFNRQQLVVIGMRANTCIESTVRYAAELGYEVTIVKDAVASYTWDQMKSALEDNLPNYARAIVSTAELIEHLSAPR